MLTTLQNFSPFIGANERAQLPAELSHDDAVAINMDAEFEVLADVDTYAEWLSTHCMGTDPKMCRIGYVPTSRGSRGAYIEALSIPHLVALQLHADQDAAARACWELRTRYLAAPETQMYLTRKAEEIAANWGNE
jgi:hypothetical protein